MNQIFAEATTTTAFLLNLSRRQCNYLLRLHAAKGMPRSSIEEMKQSGLWLLDVAGLQGLDRKGLVYWNRDSEGRANGFAGMTKAGELMAELLIEAGLTIENTNTISMLKRLDRQAA